jgi:hypothetical protein
MCIASDGGHLLGQQDLQASAPDCTHREEDQGRPKVLPASRTELFRHIGRGGRSSSELRCRESGSNGRKSSSLKRHGGVFNVLHLLTLRQGSIRLQMIHRCISFSR